jgi:hypothetical protein
VGSADTTELKRHFGVGLDDVQRDFDVAIEQVRSEVRVLAETVAAGRAETAAFREEVRSEFEEVKAMLRLSSEGR